MKLELQVSQLMTKGEEENSVRLTIPRMRQLGVSAGQKLILSTKQGEDVPVLVREAYVPDVVLDREGAFVSQSVFDLITGNISEHEVTLGCDPEFVFLKQDGRVLPANYWLPMSGQVGSDGPLAELRPNPGKHESEVVANLGKLINSLPLLISSKLGKNKVLPAGHSCWDNFAIGFHIHLGAPKAILTGATPGADQFVRSLITALDYFVGVPAMLLEDTNVRRLGDGIYGKPGDFRLKRRTIEYRTPGGFHLRHPEYAAGIMALALCVGKEILKEAEEESSRWRNLEKFASFKRLQTRYDLPEKRTIRWVLMEPTKRAAVEFLPNLLGRLRSMRYFEDHSNSIRTYFRLVMENKQHSPELLRNW